MVERRGKWPVPCRRRHHNYTPRGVFLAALAPDSWNSLTKQAKEADSNGQCKKTVPETSQRGSGCRTCADEPQETGHPHKGTNWSEEDYPPKDSRKVEVSWFGPNM
jgi:hypothetical protein